MGNTISNATTTVTDGETTCSNPTSTIVNSLTEHPPSYSVKIENLRYLKNDKYQSRRFTVGGHNWRLIIYPKGNDKDNGSGFISMYVEIDSTSEVFAYVKFFVYNKNEQKYFTIQDTEVKRFNALRMVWGFSQVLPLYLFENPKNGYIFERQKCEFGVEVMVVPPLTNWEVSFNQKLSTSIFSWTVKGFSVLKENPYVSPNFSIGGKEWVLKMYPKGTKSNGKWLSLFLHVADSETLSEDEKIYVHADLRVLCPRPREYYYNHVTHKLNACYKKSTQGWGCENFVTIANLREGCLDNDTLTLEVEFKIVSATKYSHPRS